MIPGVDPIWFWLGFIGLILLLLELDIGLFNRKDHVIGVKEAVGWTFVWIGVSMAFVALMWWFNAWSNQEALEFLTGYIVEKSLSMDNLFIFLLIFTAFKIPRAYQHRVLFWGIFGAIVMRGLFIVLGAALLSRFQWVFYIFGVIILWGAYHMQFQKEKKFDPEHSIAVRMVRWFFPVSGKDHGHDFFVKENGRWLATTLFVTLITIELSDVVFATDSIPAIFAITTDPFIVFTSNIFAILGLRSLYFALAGLHSMFVYLKTGLAIILAYIGVKMLLYQFWHPPIILSLAIILGVLGVSIIASLSAARRHPEVHPHVERDDGEVHMDVSAHHKK